MGVPARLFMVVPVLALLVWCGVLAVDYGIAWTTAANATREIERVQRSGAGETAAWVRSDLRLAAQAVPKDPSVRELIAISGPDGEGNQAERQLALAIEARPGSGYTWANLAASKYRAGDTGPSFEKAVVNAARLAPFEPEVQRTLADYGLAVLDEVGPATRAAIERAVAAGMKRNAPEILQIAARRGRLGVACRHFDGEPRPAESKWTKLCQSMEATS
jgi:hypothetical protein